MVKVKTCFPERTEARVIPRRKEVNGNDAGGKKCIIGGETWGSPCGRIIASGLARPEHNRPDIRRERSITSAIPAYRHFGYHETAVKDPPSSIWQSNPKQEDVLRTSPVPSRQARHLHHGGSHLGFKERMLGADPVERVMPNTPALIENGRPGLAGEQHPGMTSPRPPDSRFVGMTVVEKEGTDDAVTGLSESAGLWIHHH
jgi:hypothetical protein